MDVKSFVLSKQWPLACHLPELLISYPNLAWRDTFFSKMAFGKCRRVWPVLVKLLGKCWWVWWVLKFLVFGHFVWARHAKFVKPWKKRYFVTFWVFFFSRWPLANVSKSGKYLLNCLANVGKSGKHIKIACRVLRVGPVSKNIWKIWFFGKYSYSKNSHEIGHYLVLFHLNFITVHSKHKFVLSENTKALMSERDNIRKKMYKYS